MPKKDFTQVAFDVVQQATGEKPKPVPAKKKAAPPVKKVAARQSSKKKVGLALGNR